MAIRQPDAFTAEDRAALRAWSAGLSVQPVDEPFPLPHLPSVPARPVTPLSERVVRCLEGVVVWGALTTASALVVLFTISESARLLWRLWGGVGR